MKRIGSYCGERVVVDGSVGELASPSPPHPGSRRRRPPTTLNGPLASHPSAPSIHRRSRIPTLVPLAAVIACLLVSSSLRCHALVSLLQNIHRRPLFLDQPRVPMARTLTQFRSKKRGSALHHLHSMLCVGPLSGLCLTATQLSETE